jgi:two-component system response regulator RegA
VRRREQKQSTDQWVIENCDDLWDCGCPETDSSRTRRRELREACASLVNPTVLRLDAGMNEGATVLIAEDDADVLRAARIALVPYSERVETLSTVEGLDEVLASASFDVVLLDMNFVSGERSGGDGLNALARIQAYDPCLAVVLMTAYGGVALAVEALKRGAADFVLKPWRNDKLIAAVTAAAAKTRTQREKETQHLDAVERGAIERALARHEGNISLAAAELGLSRPALYRRMAKHGL